MLCLVNVPAAVCADNDRDKVNKILRDRSPEVQEGRFLLQVSPCYYKKKADSVDWLNTGLFLKANIDASWEVGLGSDFISYHSPDCGFSDVYTWINWTFYAKNDWTMALSGNVLFPTGSKAFREPGMEPSLTLLVSRKVGHWELGLSIGSTYAADEEGDPNYLDLEIGLEADYSLDTKNSFSFFSSGYGPDQRSGGSSRFIVGTSYRRMLTYSQSLEIMLMKGLSDKGMDWSGLLIYSLTF